MTEPLVKEILQKIKDGEQMAATTSEPVEEAVGG
jgi:hypothetical protein